MRIVFWHHAAQAIVSEKLARVQPGIPRALMREGAKELGFCSFGLREIVVEPGSSSPANWEFVRILTWHRSNWLQRINRPHRKPSVECEGRCTDAPAV